MSKLRRLECSQRIANRSGYVEGWTNFMEKNYIVMASSILRLVFKQEPVQIDQLLSAAFCSDRLQPLTPRTTIFWSTQSTEYRFPDKAIQS